MATEIFNKVFDEERALYALHDAKLIEVRFEGPADGESALKEGGNLEMLSCSFELRYPLWHVNDFVVANGWFSEDCRAPIWYCSNGELVDTIINGVKAIRECEDIRLKGCRVESPEFGWKSKGLHLDDVDIISEYAFLESRDLELEEVHLSGKYSFQYAQDTTISHCYLDTKDAFWHTKNVTVKDSVIKGEYLAWYSEGLTLENCKIIGTQPLCYCKDLKLINCTMEEADLAFEYSDVDADIRGGVISIKNPRSGKITVDSVEEIIREAPVYECNGEVIVRE